MVPSVFKDKDDRQQDHSALKEQADRRQDHIEFRVFGSISYNLNGDTKV